MEQQQQQQQQQAEKNNRINTTDMEPTSTTNRRRRAFRQRLITAAKTVLSSTVDIVGDWVFYSRSKSSLSLEEYHIPLLVFCIISSIFGLLTILSISLKLWRDPGNPLVATKDNSILIQKPSVQDRAFPMVEQLRRKGIQVTRILLLCEIIFEE